jgi:ArsR family transcriptional regulator
LSIVAAVTTSRAPRTAADLPVAVAEIDAEQAARLAVVVKALADPTRLRIVDALRVGAPQTISQSQFLPLFDMSQPALAKHLKVLVDAGVVRVERRGRASNYELVAGAMDQLTTWLTR